MGCNIFTELCTYHHYLILEHFHHPEKKIIVVHFMCQLAMGCPDTWSNSILSVSVKVGFFGLSLFFILYGSIVDIGEGTGTPLQYSCLENPMDGGAWWAAVHRVSKSRTRLSDFTFTFHFHALEKEMATHSSVLAWRIPGTAELVGCRLWGHAESDMTDATQHS